MANALDTSPAPEPAPGAGRGVVPPDALAPPNAGSAPRPPFSAGGRTAVWAAVAVVAVVALTLFSPIVGFNFIHRDDRINVFQNPHLALPITASEVAWFWTHSYYELYMPVTYTVWALCAAVGTLDRPVTIPGGDITQMDPGVFHRLSLILHAADAVLVLLLVRSLLPDGRSSRATWAAAMGALLFAVHPLQVESVAWTTGMNNLTSGFFALLSLLAYVLYAKGDGRQPWRYALATAIYVIALLAKPTAASVPLIAAAIDWGVLRRRPNRWIGPVAIWAALALACAVVTHITSYSPNTAEVPILKRPFVAGDALAWYLGKLVFPRYVSPVPGRSVRDVMGSWWGYVTWLVPALLAVGLWRLGGRNARYPLAALAIFTAGLLPMLGFVPFYATHYSTVADRYIYLAMLGPALAVGWLLDSVPAAPTWRRGLAFGIAGAALLVLAARASVAIPAWRDTFSMSEAALKTDPRDGKAHVNLAIKLGAEGKIPEALDHLRQAVHLYPDDPVIALYLGRSLEETGDFAGALVPLRNSVRLGPNVAEAQARYGVALAKTGHPEEAIAPLRAALKLKPGDVETRYVLGIVLGNLHRDAEAAAELGQVAAVAPDFPGVQAALAKLRARGVTIQP